MIGKLPGEYDPFRSTGRGTLVHENAELLIRESVLPRNLEAEHTVDIPGGWKRTIDRLDKTGGIIYEIKPDSHEAIGRGWDQLTLYKGWMDIHEPRPDGQPWEIRLITYSADQADAILAGKRAWDPLDCEVLKPPAATKRSRGRKASRMPIAGGR